jgi:hypothetical protein
VNGDRDDEIERRLQEISAEIKARKGDFGAKGADQPDRPGQRREDGAGGPPAPGRRKRGRVLRGWLVTVVLVGLLGGGAYLKLHGQAPDAADDTKPVTNGAVPTLPPSNSPSPPASAGAAGPPADPFAGSPAESYADGTAGITVPAAVAHGPYSAAVVQAAYTGVRKLLIAANLDPATLKGGSPAAFADLLTAQQRAYFVGRLDQTGLDSQGYERSTRAWVASFAPGTTSLVGSVIKVHGTMSAGVAQDSGREVLRIHLDYVFVYPVEPPGVPADWMRVVDRNYGDVDFATWDDPGGALEPFLYLWNGGGTAGVRCDVNDGFIHPGFPSGPGSKVKPSGTPVDPYDQSSPPPTGTACRATTGT